MARLEQKRKDKAAEPRTEEQKAKGMLINEIDPFCIGLYIVLYIRITHNVNTILYNVVLLYILFCWRIRSNIRFLFGLCILSIVRL